MEDNEERRAGRRMALARVLKSKRLAKDMSISSLAKITGLAKSNLSRLEAGEGNPSLETLWTLSAALDINVRELFDPGSRTVRVSRASEHGEAQSEIAKFGVTLLSSSPPGATRDLYRAALEPGRTKKSAPHARGMIEHIVLIAGKARVGPDQASEVLLPGDYMIFAADQPHSYEALEPETTAIIIMESD